MCIVPVVVEKPINGDWKVGLIKETSYQNFKSAKLKWIWIHESCESI